MGMVKEGVSRPGTGRSKGEDIEHREEEQAKTTANCKKPHQQALPESSRDDKEGRLLNHVVTNIQD